MKKSGGLMYKIAEATGAGSADTSTATARQAQVPQLSLENKPTTKPVKGMAGASTYSRVNTGLPPVPDAGAASQKSQYPRGFESLPKVAAGSKDDMKTSISTRPSIKDLVKMAMEGAANKIASSTSTEQVEEAPTVHTEVPTSLVYKLAAAAQYTASKLNPKIASDVGPGNGASALTVVESDNTGEMAEDFGSAVEHSVPVGAQNPGELETDEDTMLPTVSRGLISTEKVGSLEIVNLAALGLVKQANEQLSQQEEAQQAAQQPGFMGTVAPAVGAAGGGALGGIYGGAKGAASRGVAGASKGALIGGATGALGGGALGAGVGALGGAAIGGLTGLGAGQGALYGAGVGGALGAVGGAIPGAGAGAELGSLYGTTRGLVGGGISGAHQGGQLGYGAGQKYFGKTAAAKGKSGLKTFIKGLKEQDDSVKKGLKNIYDYESKSNKIRLGLLGVGGAGVGGAVGFGGRLAADGKKVSNDYATRVPELYDNEGAFTGSIGDDNKIYRSKSASVSTATLNRARAAAKPLSVKKQLAALGIGGAAGTAGGVYLGGKARKWEEKQINDYIARRDAGEDVFEKDTDVNGPEVKTAAGLTTRFNAAASKVRRNKAFKAVASNAPEKPRKVHGAVGARAPAPKQEANTSGKKGKYSWVSNMALAMPAAAATLLGAKGAIDGLSDASSTLQQSQQPQQQVHAVKTAAADMVKWALNEYAAYSSPADNTTYSAPAVYASGEGSVPLPDNMRKQLSMIASNDAAIDYTKVQAKAAPKKDLTQLLEEDALSDSSDTTLDRTLEHTSESGAKVASSDLMKIASARAVLAKLAAACPPAERSR